MAHHNSTPQTILDAPTLKPRWVHKHGGPNRQQRRKTTFGSARVFTIPKALRQPTTNLPYRKPRKP